jgi:3-deoxy-D-manno-octulosonic-acid transferase
MLETFVADGVLGLYRLVGHAGRPLIRGHMRRRAERGREDARRLGERFGIAGLERPEGPLVWCHGASVGESLSALPLIGQVRDAWPELNLLVTTGTVTSAELLTERLPEGVIHQYVPIDLPTEVRRFLDHWRPDLGLLIESELWPNLLTEAHERAVELILVNGRMSKATFKSWSRLSPLIRRLLAPFSLTLAQTPEDQRYFRDLGAQNSQCLGNLKFAAPPLVADSQELAALTESLGKRPRWLAASTHPGEDELAGEVHARLAERHPGLLTLIVPRHPDRGPDIAQSLGNQGLTVALRSAGEAPSERTEVYVADTIGELGLWYRLADVVFVGGSLVTHGGQNLLEPAAQGCAILCGPHTTNFARIAEDMAAAGALRRVGDVAELASNVERLLDDAALRRPMGEAAAAYATTQTEVLDRVFAALGPALSRAAGTSPRP